MTKILRVGDPHVKVTNIDESERLIEFIADQAIKLGVDRIELLGDLFHTHAVIRLEVIEFWTWALELLTDICEVVVLVGNHDQSGDHQSGSSALDIFSKIRNKKLYIINLARQMGPYGYIPYTHSVDRFLELSNGLAESGARVIICHQTFDGSRFENGFYAPQGIDATKIGVGKDIQIISGHIHAQQEFGNVWYPGTARWDTASDANQIKGIWLCEHESDTGKLVKKELINTDSVCVPILSITLREGEEITEFAPGARVSVELIGSSDWVSKQSKALKGKCSIKTKITDKAELKSRKSGGNLLEFIEKHFDTKFKTKLLTYMKEIGLV